MAEVIERLRPYLLGWKAYFGLAQTPKVWRELDEWVRRRLRAIQLKHWKRGTTIYRELIKRWAASVKVAKTVAGNARSWWRNSGRALKSLLTIAYFDRLGVPRSLMTSTSRTARCGPACRVVWQGLGQVS
jgi:RNA-directed DNA polymerase